MAYRGSAFFIGNNRIMPPKAQVAGTKVEIFHTHTFDRQALDTADMLELIPIPPGARVTAITYASANLPAGDLLLGWTTGEYAAPLDSRSAGTEFVNAVAHAATDINVALSVLRAQNRSGVWRSIGMRASALIGVAANRTFTIRVGLVF